MTDQTNAAQPVLTDSEILAIGAMHGRPSVALLPMFRALEGAVLSKLRAPKPLGDSCHHCGWMDWVSHDGAAYCQACGKPHGSVPAEGLPNLPQLLRENADLDAAEGGNPDVVALEWAAADEIERLRREVSKLRAPVAGEPFMYGIMGPDGKAHFEEFCVSGDRSELQAEVVDHLNRDNPEDGTYSVIALFRDAASQASASDFAKLQSAYVGSCDQIARLLASGPDARRTQHPDDIAVDNFAAAMKAKLAKKRAEGRGGWNDKSQCTAEFLSQLLRGHVDKGDPVDVGNLAMMLHQRGEAIAPAEDDGRDTAALQRLCDTLSKIVHNMVVAEQAAWIEWKHGQGAEAAMRWIGNGLAGPGHIPNEAKPYSKEAQAWYDANKADPFPVCPCGRPSNILHMGNGYCSEEHCRAAIAAQRKGDA
ncbi:hypothetical protein [Achromobacter xylosoxidans]|uniref:hypothetical protein n=1 Tax=Alcaligenes xylosoxydans xylosoxydans TaxID=85698 RepID=UPI001F144452|nr:hypothetical protein [Achromobacter xylosoxidans]